MSMQATSYPQNRAAIHYRNTDYSTGRPNHNHRAPQNGCGCHGRSVFDGRRPYHNHHQYRPTTMMEKVSSIVGTWKNLTNKFSDLFTGAASKKEIRQTKRAAKAELRDQLRSGEISRKEYRALKKQLRKAKRAAKRGL